jgi:hypothetical protein
MDATFAGRGLPATENDIDINAHLHAHISPLAAAYPLLTHGKATCAEASALATLFQLKETRS